MRKEYLSVLSIVVLLQTMMRIMIRIVEQTGNRYFPTRVIQRRHNRARRHKDDDGQDVLRQTEKINQGSGPQVHVGAHQQLERVRVDGVVETAMRRQVTMVMLVNEAVVIPNKIERNANMEMNHIQVMKTVEAIYRTTNLRVKTRIKRSREFSLKS